MAGGEIPSLKRMDTKVPCDEAVRRYYHHHQASASSQQSLQSLKRPDSAWTPEHAQNCFLLSTATALNGRFAWATLSPFTALVQQNFLSTADSSRYTPGSRFCKATQKCRYHLTTFPMRFYISTTERLLAYQHFGKGIYVRGTFSSFPLPIPFAHGSACFGAFSAMYASASFLLQKQKAVY